MSLLPYTPGLYRVSNNDAWLLPFPPPNPSVSWTAGMQEATHIQMNTVVLVIRDVDLRDTPWKFTVSNHDKFVVVLHDERLWHMRKDNLRAWPPGP